MANYLTDGLLWLHEQRHEKLTGDVSYTRKGGATIPDLKATPLKSESEKFAEEGFTVKSSLRDWMFRMADLAVDGTLVPPIVGDRVTETDSGQVWEVAELPGLDGCWRIADTSDQAIRVHCKLVTR